MLATILLTVAFFFAVTAAMAIGVAVTGKRLSGSCGGVPGAACRCSPEKRARCADKRTDEASGAPDHLAPEERLVSLSKH